MFGKKKNKKDKKATPNQEAEQADSNENATPETDVDPTKPPEQPAEEAPELTEAQKQKQEQLDSVKSKISRILKSGNIEIVDENLGDEYEEDGTSSESEKKKQQDYDSLKAAFGGKNKNKKQDLTLTIDDFDYTYVGKYVEEYDLVHRKNIKRIKLPNKALKIVKKVAIIVVLIGALIGGIVFAVNFTKEPIPMLDTVSISRDTQTYFVNEDFDFTGLNLIAHYTNGKRSYDEIVPLKIEYFSRENSRGNINAGRNSITFTGGTEVTLCFIYGGKTCYMDIKIENKDPLGLTVKYLNSIFDLKAGDVLTADYLFALIDYSNYNSEWLDFDSINLKIDGVTQTYSSADGGFTLSQDINHDSKIDISYKAVSSYAVTLTYKADQKGLITESYSTRPSLPEQPPEEQEDPTQPAKPDNPEQSEDQGGSSTDQELPNQQGESESSDPNTENSEPSETGEEPNYQE